MTETLSISLSKLVLDTNNPRFHGLYESNSQKDIMSYLLYEEDAISLSKDIYELGFFREDKPLIAIKIGSNFLVKDGNRRCAAAKYINENHKEFKNFVISHLPVVIYKDESIVNSIMRAEHISNNQKPWSRIARALDTFEMSQTKDKKAYVVKEYSQLMKVANFYFAASSIAGERFKALIRREKNNQGGKLIIFERLFVVSRLCGYNFSNTNNYAIHIEDRKLFIRYIHSIVAYLHKNPNATHHIVDNEVLSKDFITNLLGLHNNENYDSIEVDNENNIIDNLSDKSNFEKKNSRTKITKRNNELFGGALYLKIGKVNDLYRAIDKIYTKFGNDETILPVIGMSMRLLLETAARVKFESDSERKIIKSDTNIYNNFMNLAKKELGQGDINLTSITKSWVDSNENIEAILGKYAHNEIPYDRSNIINVSKVIADILKRYFGR